MAAPLNENLGFLLIAAGRLLRARFERALASAQLEVTPGEARTLVLLGLLGPVRQNELATALSVEPMTLVGYLDRLEQQGLVKRQQDPSDRRAKLAVMTEKGRPLERRIFKMLTGERSKALKNFREDEVAVLRDLLERLCHDLTVAESGADDK